MTRPLAMIAILLLAAATAGAQALTNASLNGRYFFRHLLINANTAGAIVEMRTAYGAMTFNGAGAYTYTGSQIIGPGAPAAFTGAGTYAVKGTGFVTISNPQRPGADLNAGLGQGAVVGGTTETAGVYDLFVAIPAPAATQSNLSMTGSYDVSALEFPSGSAAQIRSGSFRFFAGGNGSAGNFTLTARGAATADRITTAPVSNASYQINADGTGTFTVPGSALLTGIRALWLSADASLAILGSTASGGHDLWIATRSLTAAANNTSFRNLFFRSGLRFEGGRAGVYAGSANSAGAGKLVSSLRVRQPEGVIDLTAASAYQLNADGTGPLDPGRVALGFGGNSFQTNALAGFDLPNYEIGAGIRAASPSGTGIFISPQGVVNAASFAPVGAPVSPGGFFTLFGTGLAAATTVASALPFPTTLGNVQVLVNGTAAPIYLASAGQISALVPFATTGPTASIVVVNNGQRSNTVEIPLARSAPGIFTIPPAGTGPGALLHADFSLVGASSPAKRGETVQLFLTGLGAVAPAIRDGAAAPSNPLSTVSADIRVYIGGRPATVVFKGLAPGLAGLYQINFTVPANAPLGASVALGIETPDAFHDMVDIAIGN